MDQHDLRVTIDGEAAWRRVNGRRSLFLDTSCWIALSDGREESAQRIRSELREQVRMGNLFCPLSWGVLEELFKQAGESRGRTAALMEELSLNTSFVMRTELFAWELSRSLARLSGEDHGDSLSGLFFPPAALVGSHLDLRVSGAPTQPGLALADEIGRALSSIGVVELAEAPGTDKGGVSPPLYTRAAKDVASWFHGNKRGLFLEEAGNCFFMYITPQLARLPAELAVAWLKQFASADEVDFFLKAFRELPALHNHVELMMAADLQPSRKDSNSWFFDNEILVAPFAYANAFAAIDRGIADLLQNRTAILGRTSCAFCHGLDSLERWVVGDRP